MATDKTHGLPHVAAPTAAEISAAAIAPFVQKRLASLTRSRDACEAELKIVSDVPGFDIDSLLCTFFNPLIKFNYEFWV